MKNRRIHIAFAFMLVLFTYQGYSQDTTVCYGDYAYYGVRTDTDTTAFSSVFEWDIEGGEIIERFGDRVYVRWNSETDTGRLFVQEFGIGGCEGELKEKVVNVTRPNVDFVYEDNEICLGEVAEFRTENDYSEYLWPDGSQGESYSVDSTGYVWVKVEDEFGCESVDSVYLTVHELPDVEITVNTAYPDRISYGEDSISFIGGEVNSITLEAGMWDWYSWSTGTSMSYVDIQASDVAQATDDSKTEYFWVTVENEYGCRNTDSLAVTVIRNLKIPNAITPNGDGSNDRWDIPALSLYPNATVEIFDRWGDVVFRTNDYNPSNYWDGTDNRGRKLPMDSYFYVINLGNGEKPIYGSVTIIR